MHMGVRTTITVYAPSREVAEPAVEAAFARIAEIDSRLSDYRRESELSELGRRAGGSEPMPVSEDLYHVLQAACDFARETDGAFDPTVGPFSALWRQARREGRRPADDVLAAARDRVGWREIEFHPDRRAIRLRRPGMALDLGGIAKGYACDEALAELRRHGLRAAMVEAGGDLAAGDPPPARDGWSVRVEGHYWPFLVANGGLSTSGDTEQFVDINGIRYSHVLDPRTGLGVTNRVQATVRAPNAMTSDMLATALCVLGPRPDLVRAHNAEAWIRTAR